MLWNNITPIKLDKPKAWLYRDVGYMRFSTSLWLQDVTPCQMFPFLSLPTVWYLFPLCLEPCKASSKNNYSTGLLESEGIVLIRSKLPPVTLWEPTHFIPKYFCLASRLDLYIALEGQSDVQRSWSTCQVFMVWKWCQLTPPQLTCKYEVAVFCGSGGQVSWTGALISAEKLLLCLRRRTALCSVGHNRVVM